MNKPENVDMTKKNLCLDCIKGIACVCVVFMHCEFPGKLGIAVQAISRFCVPFFFMVSGYFCHYEDKKKEKPISKKIVHIFKITLIATIFYIIVALVHNVFDKGVYELHFTIKDLAMWAFLNRPVVIAGQLWFLFALLYVYILFSVVKKFELYKLAYILIPVLLIVYIILAQGMHLAGFYLTNCIYRNFLIEGFPLFCLGYFIHDKQKSISINNKILIIIFVGSTVLCLVERYFLGRDFGVNICTIPQVTSLFLFGVTNPQLNFKPLNSIGKKDSMMIYILHPMVWHTLQTVYSKTKLDEIGLALYAMPILVLIISFALSRTVSKIKVRFAHL